MRNALIDLQPVVSVGVFFFNDTATTEIYTLSLHDALPISTITTPELCRCILAWMAPIRFSIAQAATWALAPPHRAQPYRSLTPPPMSSSKWKTDEQMGTTAAFIARNPFMTTTANLPISLWSTTRARVLIHMHLFSAFKTSATQGQSKKCGFQDKATSASGLLAPPRRCMS